MRRAIDFWIAHKDFEMNRLNITRFGILGLALCATFVQATPPVQTAPPFVSVDGQMVKFPDMQPRFMYNHAMVPLRGVFEHMNARVDWDNGSRRVTCVSDEATVQLTLGDSEATVNGEKIHFDAPATMSHGRTLVPLAFLARALGARVDWDDPSQTVRIVSHKYMHRRR